MAIHPLPLILASTSASRKAILTQTGLIFSSHASDFNESTITLKNPQERSIALAKAKIMKISDSKVPSLIVGADTVVLFNNKVLEKPKYKMTAVSMLKELSDHIHTVLTGWAIYNNYKDSWYEGFSETYVTFRPLLHQEIIEYVNDNPVTSWAGGYNAYLSSAPLFISKVEGSLTGLNGLPVDQIVPHLIHEWAHPYKKRDQKEG